MPRSHTITLAVIIAVSTAAMVEVSRGEHEPEAKPHELVSMDKLVADLRADDDDVSGAAERELFRRLNGLSDDLTKLVFSTQKIEEKRETRREPVDRALAVLRKLDYRRFVRLLMMNVRYSDNSDQTEVTFTGGYPCATMLSDLGPSAAYEIVKYLEYPPSTADLSDEAIDLFARVCMSVYGTHNGGAKEAKEMLLRAVRRARKKEHIERLEKRLKQLVERKA